MAPSAPLGDTVGFIHSQEGHGQTREELPETRHQEALRSHQEEVRVPLDCSVQNAVPLVLGGGGGEKIGPKAIFSGPPHLIFHEGDQRAHHQDDTY